MKNEQLKFKAVSVKLGALTVSDKLAIHRAPIFGETYSVTSTAGNVIGYVRALKADYWPQTRSAQRRWLAWDTRRRRLGYPQRTRAEAARLLLDA